MRSTSRDRQRTIVICTTNSTSVQGVCQRLEKLRITAIISPPGPHLAGLVRSVVPDAIVVKLDTSPLETRTIVGAIAALAACPVLVLAPWQGIFSPRFVTSRRGVRVIDSAISNTALMRTIATQLSEEEDAAAAAEAAAGITDPVREAGESTMMPREHARIGESVVDFATRTVARDGVPHALSPTECTLLETLLAARGAAVPYAALFRALKGVERDYCRLLLAQAIHRLREKLGESPRRPRHLVTVYGFGYRLLENSGEERAAG